MSRYLKLLLVIALVLTVSLADADVRAILANRLVNPGSTPNLIGTASYDSDTRISSVDPYVFGSFDANNFNAMQFCAYGANAGDVDTFFFKTRSASRTCDANTVVNNGDTIARMRFYMADGAAFREAARISAIVDGAPGSSDAPGSLLFYTTPDASATTAQVLKLGNDKAATFAGTVTSSATASLGWAVVDGTDNTSCETTCSSAAVFGIDLAGGATAPVIVGSTSATADVCLCAGAS